MTADWQLALPVHSTLQAKPAGQVIVEPAHSFPCSHRMLQVPLAQLSHAPGHAPPGGVGSAMQLPAPAPPVLVAAPIPPLPVAPLPAAPLPVAPLPLPAPLPPAPEPSPPTPVPPEVDVLPPVEEPAADPPLPSDPSN